MAKSRLYGWNGELTEKPLSGQALIVFNGMRAEPDAMKTGHGWTESIGKQLATRQDPYRVVLYYILILKNRGVIRTNEFDINAVTKNGDTKHAVTVKTAATVEAREVVEEPAITDVPPTEIVPEPTPELEATTNVDDPTDEELDAADEQWLDDANEPAEPVADDTRLD
jgi:hypothetical protein